MLAADDNPVCSGEPLGEANWVPGGEPCNELKGTFGFIPISAGVV